MKPADRSDGDQVEREASINDEEVVDLVWILGLRSRRAVERKICQVDPTRVLVVFTCTRRKPPSGLQTSRS